MQELHCHTTDFDSLIHQSQQSCRRELAEHRDFDIFAVAEFFQSLKVFGWNRHDHAFLSFADPNLGIAQASVFKGRFIEPNFGSNRFAHFADGTAEAAGPAVGYRRIKFLVPRL